MLLGLLLHAGVSAVLAKGRRNRQPQDSDGQPPRTCAGPLGIEGLSVPHARHLVEEPGVELSMSATFINLLPFSASLRPASASRTVRAINSVGDACARTLIAAQVPVLAPVPVQSGS